MLESQAREWNNIQKNRSKTLAAILLGMLLHTPVHSGDRATDVSSNYPVDAPLGGPISLFTDSLSQLARKWPEGRHFCHCETEPLQIQTEPIPTADRPYYVGFRKCMTIRAPLVAVAHVLDDVEHYQQLFPGDKEVEILQRDGNKKTLAWKRKIPVFFVPDVEYQIDYVSWAPNHSRKMYRSQLRQGSRLKFSDALMVIESAGPFSTLYSDYEFYEADYGIGLFGIKAVGSDAVWKESLQGSFLSLLSIRLKAEHPDWDYRHIATSREEALHAIKLERIIHHG